MIYAISNAEIEAMKASEKYSKDGFRIHFTPEETKAAKELEWKCSCCGYQSRPSTQVPSGYMDWYEHPKFGPQLMCSVCIQAYRINWPLTGIVWSKGDLIYLEDGSQGEVTTIAVTLLAMWNATMGNYTASEPIKDRILSLGGESEKLNFLAPPGEEWDGIKTFMSLWDALPPGQVEMTENIFRNVFFVPERSTFSAPIKYWSAANLERQARRYAAEEF